MKLYKVIEFDTFEKMLQWKETAEHYVISGDGDGGWRALVRAEDAERKVRAWNEIAALLAKCVDEFTAALRALEADGEG